MDDMPMVRTDVVDTIGDDIDDDDGRVNGDAAMDGRGNDNGNDDVISSMDFRLLLCFASTTGTIEAT